MKRVLLLGPALAAVLSLPCAGAAEAPAARRAFAAVPGPDAEYLLLQDRYVLESDGGIVHERTVRLKINSFVAMHRLYGESRVEFDPATTAIETLHNRTVLPNGRVVPAPENAVIDDLPPAAHRNPLWSRLGRRVFVHTALEPGAVIELGWRLTHRPDAFPWLEVNEAMAAEIPIAERVVRIELPAGVRLRGGVAGLPADDRVVDPSGSVDQIQGRMEALFCQPNFRGVRALVGDPAGTPGNLGSDTIFHPVLDRLRRIAVPPNGGRQRHFNGQLPGLGRVGDGNRSLFTRDLAVADHVCRGSRGGKCHHGYSSGKQHIPGFHYGPPMPQ